MKKEETSTAYPPDLSLRFKSLDCSDRRIISSYAEKYNQYSCEYSFASLYMWNDLYRYKLAFFNGWLIVLDTRNNYLLMPMGADVNFAGLLELSLEMKQAGYSGDISNVPPEFIEKNPDLVQYYDIENERAMAEYVYSTENLVTLGGKKLRKKRNHISRFFRKHPDYQVRSLSSNAVREDCLTLVEDLALAAGSGTVDKGIHGEAIAIQKGMGDFKRIPLEGIAIYVKKGTGERLAGFAVYSRLNREVYIIHFEKVDYSYPGIAQVINWETAKVLREECRYINREQDLGIPGLRKAKLSYEPELIYPAIFLKFRGSSQEA